MKRSIVFAAFICILMIAAGASATIRYVSLTGAGTYSTVGAAITAAVNGDTILIGPGTYVESLAAGVAKRLVWIGAGWDQTTFNGNSSNWYFSSGTGGTVLEGIHFVNVGYYPALKFVSAADSISVRRCLVERSGSTGGNLIEANGYANRLFVEDCILIHNFNSQMITLPNAATLWRNCVFATASTTTSAILAGTATTGTTELYDCVFLNARTVFSLPSGAQPVIAINNVFYDWGTTPTFGTYPGGTSTCDYNASTSAIAAPGTNAIALGETDPFVNYDEGLDYVHGTSDLHLAGGSPLIDAGHPNLTDFLDATRSDLGIYGGPRPLLDGGVPNYPWAVNIVITPNLVGQGTPVNAAAVGRVGPQY